MFVKTPVFTATFLATLTCAAAVYETETFETSVSVEDQCLLMRKYGDVQPQTMLIWLHGYLGDGGPSNYHFRTTEKSAADFSEYKRAQKSNGEKSNWVRSCLLPLTSKAKDKT